MVIDELGKVQEGATKSQETFLMRILKEKIFQRF